MRYDSLAVDGDDRVVRQQHLLLIRRSRLANRSAGIENAAGYTGYLTSGIDIYVVSHVLMSTPAHRAPR